MRFFDANPPGRILNRFSKDLDEGNIYTRMLCKFCVFTYVYKFLVPLTSLQLIINIFIHNSRCLFTPTSRHVLPNRQPSPVITYIGRCCLTLDCHSNSACSHILLLLQNRVVCVGASIQAFGKHSAVATSWSCKHFSSGPDNDRSIQAASKQYSKVCNKTSFFKYNFWLFR